VALRKLVERITKPVDEVDRENLATWCEKEGGAPMNEVQARRPTFVAGEIRSVRIVPRAGADALEATVSDGRSTVTAVFLGRRKIPGLSPGRRIKLEGVIGASDERYMYNPVYTLV
jgi:hypothetical protein